MAIIIQLYRLFNLTDKHNLQSIYFKVYNLPKMLKNKAQLRKTKITKTKMQLTKTVKHLKNNPSNK